VSPATPIPTPRPRRRRWLRRWLSARGRRLEITRSGWLFILLTLAVGLAAMNSGANLLHAIFGAQMTLILGSGVLSELTLRRVAVRRVLRGPLHAEEPGPAEVRLLNLNEDDLTERKEDLARILSTGVRIGLGAGAIKTLRFRLEPGTAGAAGYQVASQSC